MERQASKLLAMLAHHHQGLFGWFMPWCTSTEPKGNPTIKSTYAEDIGKFLLLTAPMSPISTRPVSAGNIALTQEPSSSNDHTNSLSQHNRKGSGKTSTPKK